MAAVHRCLFRYALSRRITIVLLILVLSIPQTVQANPVLVGISIRLFDYVASYVVGKALDHLLLGSSKRDLSSMLNELEREQERLGRQYSQHDRRYAREIKRIDAEIELIRHDLRIIEDLVKGLPTQADIDALELRLVRQLNEFRQEMDRLNIRVAGLENRQREFGLRQNELERRQYELEKRQGEVDKRIDKQDEQLDMLPRIMYMEFGPSLETMRYEENEELFSMDNTLYRGWYVGAGMVHERVSGHIEWAYRGKAEIRDVEQGLPYAAFHRNRGLAVLAFPYTRAPGLEVRLSGEYRSVDLSSDEADYRTSQARVYAVGFGLGVGGWNIPRTKGGGIRGDFRYGIADIELQDNFDDDRALKDSKAGVFRLEAWGSWRARSSFWMLHGRLFYELEEIWIEDDMYPIEPLPFWSRYQTFGATVGMRFLIR